MTKCIVEIFGLPREITEVQKVEVELKDRANLGDVIAALRRKIPALEESVYGLPQTRKVRAKGFRDWPRY